MKDNTILAKTLRIMFVSGIGLANLATTRPTLASLDVSDVANHINLNSAVANSVWAPEPRLSITPATSIECPPVNTLSNLSPSEVVTCAKMGDATAAGASTIAGANSLVITKSVVGSANSGPFNVTISGPNGYVTNTTITSGVNTFTNLPTGIYTITETSPGAGWVTTYTVEGESNATSAVVFVGGVITAAATAPGTIMGAAFIDYNDNGVRDSGLVAPDLAVDGGVADVIVTAYDRDGNAAGTTTTDASGAYTLSTTASGLSGPYRIQFTNVPAGYEPSAKGVDNDTSVQFVNAGATNVNLGVLRPTDYCQNNPLLCMAAYGVGDPLAANSFDNLSELAAGTINWDGTGLRTVAQNQDFGSVWGVAYQRATHKMYVGAALVHQQGFGPLGMGGVYVVNDPQLTSSSAASFVDLNAAPYGFVFGDMPANSARSLSYGSFDAISFPWIARQGIGDIDVSEDGNALWLMNMYTMTGGLASLIKLDVTDGVAGAAAQYPLANMNGLPTCNNGVLRPWALKFANSKGYFGAVCSAENEGSSSDLMAYVLSFDPANPVTVTQELSMTMAYTKGDSNSLAFGSTDTIWYPWLNVWNPPTTNADWNYPGTGALAHPTPILSDIEFDAKGNMILSFGDRGAKQFAGYTWSGVQEYNSGGDLLKACVTANGTYVLESNGICGGVSGAGVADGKGPGGGEFYDDNTDLSPHEEAALGGLAQWPGNSQLVYTGMDPIWAYQSGLFWVDNNTGAKIRSASVTYAGSKADGMGDVEVLCDLAPIEIGNRVWYDVNGNGVQDGGELPISGVEVSLVTGSGTVTTTTDANGTYYFTHEATSGAYSTTLRANTPYTIYINPAQSPLVGWSLTTANAQSISGSVTSNNAFLDTIDSDANLIDGVPTIYYTTETAGHNNHGLDFGFTQSYTSSAIITNTYAPAPVKIGNRLWIESDADGLASTGTITPVVGQVVTATSSTGVVYTATTDANGLYTITVPANATYTVTTDTPAGTRPSAIVTTSGTDANAAAGNDTNHVSTGTPVTVTTADNLSIDFGFLVAAPTAIELGYFSAEQKCDVIEVEWQALSEWDVAGYQIYRSGTGRREDAQVVGEQMVFAQGAGASYSLSDGAVKAGRTYTYWLEEVNMSGAGRDVASISVTANGCAVTSPGSP